VGGTGQGTGLRDETQSARPTDAGREKFKFLRGCLTVQQRRRSITTFIILTTYVRDRRHLCSATSLRARLRRAAFASACLSIDDDGQRSPPRDDYISVFSESNLA